MQIHKTCKQRKEIITSFFYSESSKKLYQFLKIENIRELMLSFIY